MIPSTNRLLEHIKYLARTFSVNDLQYVTVLILIELGVPAKLEGYWFLKTAIKLYGEDSIRMVNNGLYVAVARKYGKTVTKELVERGIHEAIRAAWENRSGRKWDCYFAGTNFDKMKPPSNHEFIAEIVRVLDLFIGIRKAYENEMLERELEYGVK